MSFHLGLLGAVLPYLLFPTPHLQDVKRCLNALEELGTLQVTSHILQKNTDVVATLKKVGGAGGRRVPAGQGLLRASGFLASGLAGGSAVSREGAAGMAAGGTASGRGARPAALPEPGLSVARSAVTRPTRR